ncbi:MAG: DUF3467 domain-containing protein [Bacteroidales bacterium]|jgi:hypothetical protein|nr:DUF3467 domain-containing protein [Bacteroidales bacterium]
MEDKQINIELTEEIAQGVYSNLAIITHSSSEFVLDFIRMMPGLPKAKVQSRIVITPEHTKKLFLALQENIAKYEAQYGTIKIANGSVPPTPIPLNFGAGTAQA